MKSQLNKIEEQQIENEQSLNEHEQFEEDIHELKAKSRRIFSELIEDWQKDERVRAELDFQQNKLLHHDQQVNKKLEDKIATYLKEKRQLSDLEEALYTEQRRLLHEEDKT